jgi:hypothetical protein
MPDYRAFLIGPDGHVFHSVVVQEPDDAAAIAAARPLADEHDVELWHEARKVAKFEQEKRRA